MNVTEADLDLATRTVYGEIRNGNRQQMLNVAFVIRNRAAHPRWWGRTVSQVCLKDSKGVHQFSCWNEGDPNREKLLKVDESDPVFAQCMAAARDALLGDLVDATHRADHYATLATKPWWAKNLQPVHNDGKHRFYRLELPCPTPQP